MGILGHGVDVVEISRIERYLAQDEEAFSGWFTASELEEIPAGGVTRVQRVAGRIAAKEAAAKALGTGFSEAVSWQDIQITTDHLGAPRVVLTGGAAKTAHETGVTRILVSISHSTSIAIASALALSD